MKVLLVHGGGDADYAALTFEDSKLKASELWAKSKEAGKALEYKEDEDYFKYEALEIDCTKDALETILDLAVDYDSSKHTNLYSAE